nr:hypothetical protein CFP56_60952 [Quercus suber]
MTHQPPLDHHRRHVLVTQPKDESKKIKHVERIWSKFLAHLPFINTLTPTSPTAHTNLPQVHSHIPPNSQSNQTPSLSPSLSNISTNTQPSFLSLSQPHV